MHTNSSFPANSPTLSRPSGPCKQQVLLRPRVVKARLQHHGARSRLYWGYFTNTWQLGAASVPEGSQASHATDPLSSSRSSWKSSPLTVTVASTAFSFSAASFAFSFSFCRIVPKLYLIFYQVSPKRILVNGEDEYYLCALHCQSSPDVYTWQNG